MKKIIAFLFFISAMCVSTFAQSLSFELDKIRQIKLLESTRDDVKRILYGYKSDDEGKDDETDYSETFLSEKINIEVSYTTGNCSDDEDYTDEWNVPKGKVKLVQIFLNDSVKFKDLQFNTSLFRKEQAFANLEDLFYYHNKELGIAIKVEKETVEQILLFPVTNKRNLLCKNEESENTRKVYSSESFFFVPNLEDRILVKEYPPNGTADIKLSADELTVSCSMTDSADDKNCSNSPRIIFVSAASYDPENDDNLVFHYTVSGGRIIGKGKNITWDLSDVKAGKYTITAGVDDGCGICGETKTKEVVVKECPDCR